jgi:peptidoglycan/xylan/chitin deacetylase (PgdA/CDA1 family)
MSNLQQYQKYRLEREPKATKFVKWLIWLIILFVIILIFKSCLFPGNKTNENANANVNATENINTNANSNENTNQNANTNTNTNSNANSNTNTSSSTSGFTLADCKAAFSQGQSNRKEIALTFDGGASTGSVQAVLDILKNNNIPATFFFTGEWVENNPNIIKNIDSLGFTIHNHSYSHPHIANITADALTEEINKTEKIIYDLIGKTTKPFFRPPYGEINDQILATVKKDGYCPILWTVDALDWETTQTADAAKERVLSKAKNGAIILMHVGDDLVPKFLLDTVNGLKDKGYTLVTLEQILSS